jgi:hypothetical protein
VVGGAFVAVVVTVVVVVLGVELELVVGVELVCETEPAVGVWVGAGGACEDDGVD